MEYLSLGKIVDSFGVDGTIKIYSTTSFGEKRYRKGSKVFIYNPQTKERIEYEVVKYRHSGFFDFVRFEEVKILFFNPNREKLYQAINDRVDQMFENGLVDEVKELLKKYEFSLTAYQAIGYKEVIDYLNGKTTLDECKELIKKRTRNYAKRQVTFFKHQFDTIEFNNKKELLDYLLKENE